MQGIPDQVRYDAFGIDPYGILPIPAFPNQGKESSVTLNSIQSRIIERFVMDGIIFNYPSEGDSESDYAVQNDEKTNPLPNF